MNRKGTAALEFALWLVPVLTLLSGVVEVSRMLSLEHVVSRAARDAARVGSLVIVNSTTGNPASQTDIETASTNHGFEVLNDSGYPCAGGCIVTSSWTTNTDGLHMLTVRVVYPFTPLLGFYDFNHPVVREFTMMTQK